MPLPQKVADRYEVLSTLGEGGMGVVYLARDSVVQRQVAVKTIRDLPSETALELFHKECNVLAAMSHPNIVEIFDIGEFEDEGGIRKPYFVMPLLRGETLGQLIRNATQRLTLERSIEIILQTCRGLQAAHERGLVHRDLKPNNIFVLPDDSVKIIDFGVAHMADLAATMTVKGGTLLYMAPEQIEMKPASPSSDIFSLGVVAYEILTGRRPFAFPSEPEVIEAILHHTPPPASEVNPSIPTIYSRIIHKAMAKQPCHRFSSARELAETLQKAQRNEPIEIFDASRLVPRLERATKALEQGNLEFAGEIVGELESAGEIDATLSDLRQRLDTATRQKTLSRLLDSARTRMEGEEYLLALQKVQEVLQLDPQNATAMGMRNAIEVRRNEHQVEEWLQLARRHLERNDFGHAREALGNLLKIAPGDSTACQLLAEAERREEQCLKARKEKEELYQAARAAWKSGEISSALTKLERLIELGERVGDGGDTARGLSIQNLYKELRSEQDLIRSSHEEARARVEEGNYAAALGICQKYLQKYPGHALFQALQFDIAEKQRQALSAEIAEIGRRVEAEGNLDRRVDLLRAALEEHPEELHFQQALRVARDELGEQTLAASAGAQGQALAHSSTLPASPAAAQPTAGIPESSARRAEAGFEQKASVPGREEAAPLGATIILGPNRVERAGRPPREQPAAQPDWKAVASGRTHQRSSARRLWMWGVGAAVASAAMALPILWFVPVPIELRTSPSGAALRVDGVVRGPSNLRLKLRPGAHRIELSKTGYSASTHTVIVRSWAGALLNPSGRSVEFQMKAAPRLASLIIRGGTAGAEVRIDGTPAGTVGADGRFSTDQVAAGFHEVRLSASGYEPKGIQSTFETGRPVVIAGADACLQSSTGTLRLRVAPAEATVTYTRSGGKAQTAGGREIELAEGVYTITGRAPGFAEQSQVVRMTAGQTKTLEMHLRTQTAQVMGMAAWNQEGWKREGAWYARRGGEFVLFPAKPVSGTLVFTALRRTGNNRIQWMVNYRDSRNYLLFAVDRKSFYRTEVADGRKRELPRIGLPAPPPAGQLQYTFRIDVSDSALAHFLQSGDRWVPLHSMSLPANGPGVGAFGFYLPGNDELLISGFAFTPKS